MTTKPISTISYNTEPFLKSRLETLLKRKAIVDYRFIFHTGEDGDKDHYHVWVDPNSRIDCADLKDFFKEIDPTNPKPLGVLPWRNGESLNWIMYVIHDPTYLANHNSDNDGDGKIPYSYEQIVTPEPEQLYRDYKRAVNLRETTNQKILGLLNKGMHPVEIVATLNANVFTVQALYKMHMDRLAEFDLERRKAECERLAADEDGVLIEGVTRTDIEF